MNIVVIAPHPDDETIGCGGTICRHVKDGDTVTAVFLTSGELGLKHLPRAEAWRTRESEARRAAKVLGLESVTFLRQPDWMLGDQINAAAESLRPILNYRRPERLYLPHPADGHPDHRSTLTVVVEALRGMELYKPVLLGYEVWTPLSNYDCVHDVTKFMSRKLRALRCHRSQLSGFDYVQAIRGLNAYRGALASRSDFAEVFQSLSCMTATQV
jgi:LmbE family N-acetylglucosaminyl deacetylase